MNNDDDILSGIARATLEAEWGAQADRSQKVWDDIAAKRTNDARVLARIYLAIGACGGAVVGLGLGLLAGTLY